MSTSASTTASGLPPGFRIELDHRTCALDESTLIGGAPLRLLRLSPAGRDALSRLHDNAVTGRADADLARKLTDRGLAHPVPPEQVDDVDVTVVIPVRDRPELLERCLDAIGRSHPVVVVDDASTEPVSVAAVAARHGAMLLRLGVNAGPAAARNAGLRSVTTNLVVFLDSDCVPSSGWIRSLAAHLVDPLVGAVAPRIRPVPAASGPHAYAQTNGALDLGPHPALVGPRSAVAYVPTAALLVRRSAAQDFDESMRFGEDVDLVWRLREAGWRVRYEPSVEVAHQEPNSWRSLLLRRFHYGTSAGPLARRHPGAMAPVALPPWALIAVAGTVLRQPSLVGLGVGGTLVATTRGLRRAGLPGGGHRLAAETLCRTWAGAGRYLTQLAGPVIVAAALPRQARPGRRLVLAALVLAGPLAEWVNRRPALGPARYVAARIADDVAYGAGVWTGAVQARTSAPVRPTFIRLRTRQSEDQS